MRRPSTGPGIFVVSSTSLRPASTGRSCGAARRFGAVLVPLANDLVEVERLAVEQRAQTKVTNC